MTRVEKITLLQQVAAGMGTIDDLQPMTTIMMAMYDKETGLFECQHIPASWGYPDLLTVQQAGEFYQKLNDVCRRREQMGLELPVLFTYDPLGVFGRPTPPKSSVNEPII